MFDITGKTLKPVSDARSSDEMEHWWNILVEDGRAKKAAESVQKSMTSTEIESLARQVFDEVSVRAVDAGVALRWTPMMRASGARVAVSRTMPARPGRSEPNASGS